MTDTLLFQAATDLRVLIEAILQSVPDAMVLSDESGTVLAFSASAEKLFGYRASEVIGKDVAMLMTDMDSHNHGAYINAYLKTGERQIIGIGRVVQARLSDGSVIPVHLTIGEVSLGEYRLFAGYIRDVTEKQAADHQISKMQAELANFSRLSTAGTMASAMAHELNQPLTAVANYLEAARDMLDKPDANTLTIAREALDAAASQSVRAGNIVRRLRDYVSRGEFETHSVNVQTLIEQAMSLSKAGAQDARPRMVMKVPDPGIEVWCDALQIRQVILNLVKNSADATKGMEAALIVISTQIDPRDPECVRISVSDNGPGLQLGEDRSPFEPFQSSKTDGMGLGLSICQTIVEAHDGHIWTDTSELGGARFNFTLKVSGRGEVEDE